MGQENPSRPAGDPATAAAGRKPNREELLSGGNHKNGEEISTFPLKHRIPEKNGDFQENKRQAELQRLNVFKNIRRFRENPKAASCIDCGISTRGNVIICGRSFPFLRKETNILY
jgi:hypothetical protein